MATSRQAPAQELEVTIISGKHLKNVNWKNGELKAYAISWIQAERRVATKPDELGSTHPVWNETFTLPITLPLSDPVLHVEVFHSDPSETPKPLVGSTRLSLRDLDRHHPRLHTLPLTRPSGRPHGKLRLKLALRDRPDYQIAPPPTYYYSSAPPLAPAARDYNAPAPPPPYSYMPSHPPPAYGSYLDSGYYAMYYPPQPRPNMERTYSGCAGPSAPLDYDHKQQRGSGSASSSRMGLAVGAVAGAMGGLALEEGFKYEEDKIADKDLASRDGDYTDYRGQY